MEKREKSGVHNLLSFSLWLVGVIVSLSVGASMIYGLLKIPFIPLLVTAIAGWVVIVLCILSVILGIADAFSHR